MSRKAPACVPKLTVVVCSVGLAALCASAAGPLMLLARAQTKPAVIRGRIVAGDTGRPLRRAQITLSPVDGGASRNTSTNIQGRYELKDLAPGRYVLSARCGGYLALQYGQTRPGEQSRPLQIGEAQTLEDIDFSLPRTSSISGRILDEIGEPMAGVIVWAMRADLRRRTEATGGRRRRIPGHR